MKFGVMIAFVLLATLPSAFAQQPSYYGKLCVAMDQRMGGLGAATHVPQEWTGVMCRQFAVDLGGQQYRLGCMTTGGQSIGPITSTATGTICGVGVPCVTLNNNPVPPSQNCGW